MTSSDLERVPVPAVRHERRVAGSGRLVVAILIALVAIPVFAAFVSDAVAPGLPKGDFARIEMRALDVPGDLPLTGVYSRYGWDHPGPMLFYLAALPVRIFGPVGLSLTAAVINLASAGGLIVVMYRRGGELLAALGAALALLIVRALQIEVVSIWNPWVPILPFALAVALAWSVWCRDWRALPWLALVVTFIVQTHIGFALVGAFLLGSALAWAGVVLVQGRRTATVASDDAPPVRWPIFGTTAPGRSLVAALLLLLLLWIPPVVEQLTRDPGNLSSILEFGRSGGAGEALVGPTSALRHLSEVVGINGTLVGGITRTVLFVPEGVSIWPLVAVVVPFLAAAALASRRRASDAIRLAVIVAMLVFLGWISIARIAGPAYPYLTEWLVVGAAFLWLSAIWSIIAALWPEAVEISLVPSRSQGARAPGLTLVVSVVLLALVASTTVTSARSPGDGYAGAQVVEQFADPASAAIGDAGLVLVAAGPTDATNSAWWLETTAIVSGLQAELQRRGFDVVADDDQEFAVGREHVVRGRAVDLRLVVSADTSVVPVADPVTTVSTYDYLDPDDRRRYQELDRKGGTVPPTPLEGAELSDWIAFRGQAVQYRLTVLPG